jgi:hypothetical protein
LLLAASGCGAPQATSHLRLTDDVGDVLLADSIESSDAEAKNVDLIAADIRRTRRFLQVRLAYDDLAPRASSQWGVSFLVATSRGGDYISTVNWERSRWVDSGDWHQGVHVVKAGSEDDVKPRCPHAATAKVDYPNATLTIRVMNRCLDGGPAWMRVDDLETYSRESHGSNDYADNPFNATDESESTPHLLAPAS